MRGLLTNLEGLTRALWWSTTTDAAVLRERTVDHGQHDARQRIAYLFYEMLIRYSMIGQLQGDSFPFATTQQDIGDGNRRSKA